MSKGINHKRLSNDVPVKLDAPFVSVTVPEGRPIAIVGDIAGESDMLIALMAHIERDVKDPLFVAAGDFVDGPNVPATLKELKRKGALPLLGNHEIFYMRYARFFKEGKSDFSQPWDNADFEKVVRGKKGHWFLELSPEARDMAFRHLRSLPLAIELNRGNLKLSVVHAEGYQDWEMTKNILAKYHEGSTYLRNEVIYRCTAEATGALMARGEIKARDGIGRISNVDFQFMGHIRFKEVTKWHNRIYVDTGGALTPKAEVLRNGSGRLSAAVVTDAHIVDYWVSHVADDEPVRGDTMLMTHRGRIFACGTKIVAKLPDRTLRKKK